MTRTHWITALLATTAAVGGATYFARQRERQRVAEPNLVPLITPVIDMDVAVEVVARLERIAGDSVTLVLHTLGGCVSSCVLIAEALRQFPEATAVVPYVAASGGTLITLAARHIRMGKFAALSAVDPQVLGRRARHIPQDDDDGLYPAAQEYERTMAGYLRRVLGDHLLRGLPPGSMEPALALFMGRDAPHNWPIQLPALRALGLPVETAEPEWADLVDAYGRWW